MTNSWQWRAHYADGSLFEEVDADGSVHGFGEIALDRCVAFELIPQRYDLSSFLVVVDSVHGIYPVFFRRHTLGISLDGSNQGTHDVVHCIGWERREGWAEAAFTFLFEDGSVLLTADKNAV